MAAEPARECGCVSHGADKHSSGSARDKPLGPLRPRRMRLAMATNMRWRRPSCLSSYSSTTPTRSPPCYSRPTWNATAPAPSDSAGWKHATLTAANQATHELCSTRWITPRDSSYSLGRQSALQRRRAVFAHRQVRHQTTDSGKVQQGLASPVRSRHREGVVISRNGLATWDLDRRRHLQNGNSPKACHRRSPGHSHTQRPSRHASSRTAFVHRSTL